jgi:hypothetical protein
VVIPKNSTVLPHVVQKQHWSPNQITGPIRIFKHSQHENLSLYVVLQPRLHNQTHRTFEIKAQCPEATFRSLGGHVYLQLNTPK